MCAIVLGLLAMALFYGDDAAVGIWLAILTTGGLLAYFVARLSLTYATVAGVAYASGSIWAAHFALPPGGGVMVLYLAYGLMLFALLESKLAAVLVIAVTLAPPALAIAGGHLFVASAGVPPWLPTMWTLLVVALVSNVQLSRSRRRLATSLAGLKRTRIQMLLVQDAQQEHQVALARASEDYRVEIDRLTVQMMTEARLTEDLRLRQDDKKSIVQAIHHDLKEPLRSIVSFTQLARRRLNRYRIDPSLGEYLAFAEDGGRRMSVMLADLVSYTSDADHERSVPVDLDVVCEEVLKNLHDSVARTGARVDVGRLPIVEGQRTQLVQLFQNLLSNALKFSRAGVPPQLHISARVTDQGRLEVRVSDNGIGIPPNQLDKVFGLFNRAHAGEAYEGSGVGLALCRKIVIGHGGQIRVASAGEGTCFTFDLPLSPVPTTGKPITTKRPAYAE